MTASGYPASTFAVSSGALPGGLALNPTTGAITGVPLTAGSSLFTITASNQVRPDATASYTLSVRAAASPVVPPRPVASSNSGLAVSGADFASIGAAGLLLLLAGASLFVRRRKTTR